VSPGHQSGDSLLRSQSPACQPESLQHVRHIMTSGMSADHLVAGTVKACSGLTGADAMAANASTLLRSYWGTDGSAALAQPWAGDVNRSQQLPLEHNAADGQHASPGTDSQQPAKNSETYMVSG